MAKCICHVDVENIFIGAGCNRVVNGAAWGPDDLVAFGVQNAVAIFSPQQARILLTLPGHKDFVKCVEFVPKHQPLRADGFTLEERFLLSGSADGVIILWAYLRLENKWRKVMDFPSSHEKAVTCIAGVTLSVSEALFVSCSSDCTVWIWHALFSLQAAGECKISFCQSISLGSRAVEAASLAILPESNNVILAMGGLDNHIYLHVRDMIGQFTPACVLKGHQDWVRSLDFSLPMAESDGHALYLASSAQDRYIRIWKISSKYLCSAGNSKKGTMNSECFSLKMYIDGPVFKTESTLWQVSLESLLVGHEDWVYSVRWKPPVKKYVEDDTGVHCNLHQPLSVLSASMDRTMMIWEPDSRSGLWMNVVTVGELGHSALGFFGGLWSPEGDTILAHAFSGSFHMWWNVSLGGSDWQPQLVPSGHSAPVVDVAWAKTGQFLLSASHDQTTRLFSPWDWSRLDSAVKRSSWHEIARPQVHGHDFNCITVLRGKGNHAYVSGAEEKVARVLEAPVAFLETLQHTVERENDGKEKVGWEDVKALGANMSALGLSQKPIYMQGVQNTGAAQTSIQSLETIPAALPRMLTAPPLDEHLAWNTLWPETHKLYGHGNELFSMCCDHKGKLLATACKAQSATVAEIWLWQVGSWRPVSRLHSHALTVTQMEFSHNDEDPFKLVSRVEAHKRIIWTCSWSPCDRFFATGSRDKFVKIWFVKNIDSVCTVTLAVTFPPFKSSITALAWDKRIHFQEYVLAVGMEDGLLELWKVRPPLSEKMELGMAESLQPLSSISRFDVTCFIQFDVFSCHVASVNRLVWMDNFNQEDIHKEETNRDLLLASCGMDHTVRLFNIKFS
eukprot:c23766_g1_i3 orf=377-2911(+)